ncbi:hypothetical protein MMC25_004500 [Agyrium rufum]|nr:hypothetical protein [Agyrium rufum]
MAQGGSVDIVPEGDMAQFLSQPLLRGAKSMTATAKDVVRVNFDPKIVGARTLIESTFQIGCRLAPLKVPHELRASRKHVRHMGYSTVLSAIFTIPVLVLAWAPLVPRPIPYGAVSLVLATLVQVLIAGPFYPKALQSLLFSRTIELDLLIVLSTSAAYVFSVVSFVYLACGHPLSTGEFFETSTLLVTLIMVGQWLSALARQKAVESISIRSLQSSNAQLLTAAGEHVAEIDTKLLQYGDVFGVSPETTIPTDGIVITGSSEADESMLTGESRPVEKQPGSLVIAGSINISGKLIVRLTRLPVENTISTIASMVDNAKLTKPKVQDLADRVASYFVPVVLLLAIMTLVIWIAIGVTVRNQTGSEATIQAITYAITVLIVSCPCAIGLAVPMVIVISSGIAAKHGVVFKSAESLEIAYKATHIVFDKTGTLTEGRLSVIEEHYMVEDEAGTRAMIRSLAKNSKHPVSAAVAAHIGAVKGISAPVGDIKAFPRLGVEGKIHGRQIRAGSASWLGFTLDPQVQILLGKGLTLYCVVIETRLCAVFGLADTIRADSAALVAKLYERGLRVMLLSGDEEGAVRKVATQLAPYPFEALSRCPPGDKQNHIQRLLSTPVSNNKRPVVIFVGDGTNDAAALAQASIGVHMASGTDVAQSAADVILMRPSLQGVLTMIDISRAAMLRVKINFGWSLIYNILALLFASGALVNATNGGTIRLPPAYAGLGELVNVMPVIAIALGLRWVRF